MNLNPATDYAISESDRQIILDALESLHENMKNKEKFGLPNDKPYSMDDVDGLFQSFENSGVKWK